MQGNKKEGPIIGGRGCMEAKFIRGRGCMIITSTRQSQQGNKGRGIKGECWG